MDPKETVERHYLEYLRSNERFNERWLLMQNLATTELRQKVLAALDLAEGHQVLDLGCGFGVLTLDLAAGTPVQVTGIDTSEQKIRVANQVLHSILETVGNLPGQVVFKVDDGYNLPFANEQFDWVISQYVFEHLKNPQPPAKIRTAGAKCSSSYSGSVCLCRGKGIKFHTLGTTTWRNPP